MSRQLLSRALVGILGSFSITASFGQILYMHSDDTAHCKELNLRSCMQGSTGWKDRPHLTIKMRDHAHQFVEQCTVVVSTALYKLGVLTAGPILSVGCPSATCWRHATNSNATYISNVKCRAGQ